MKILLRRALRMLIALLMLVGALPVAGQSDVDSMDLIMVQSGLPSYSKVKFLKNCSQAEMVAEKDIEEEEIFLLMRGGITPVVKREDQEFERRFKVTYHDYGDMSVSKECMRFYNMCVFNFLTEEYGNTWLKYVRSDVVSISEWKKRQRKASREEGG